ncbi:MULTISPECIES: hypothetical protein [Streptomyces]|uniref:Uncharacterized protein n=2 Tax=Streptomyces TaxID=1883 RepID=A0ABV9IIL4_9ACTN
MPPTPLPAGPPQSAAELNEAIRALWPHPDARLTDEQREEYRRLLAKLDQVERGEMTTAA